MKDKVLERLANIATVQTNINRIKAYGRSVIPKPQLHALVKKLEELDKEFIDCLLEDQTSSVNLKDPDIDIAAKVKEAKAAMNKSKINTSVEETGAVVVNPPVDVPEHVKNTKTVRRTRKTKTKDAEPAKE